MKKCRDCQHLKDESMFSRAKSKDGLTSYCKPCAAARARSWYVKNRERGKETRKQYREANRDQMNAIIRAWHQEHAEEVSVYKRQWAAINHDRLLPLKRKNQQSRRARKLAQFVEEIDPVAIFERDQGTCQLCFLPVEDQYHIDHIIPLSKGGEHSYLNVQLAHPTCNLRKGAK